MPGWKGIDGLHPYCLKTDPSWKQRQVAVREKCTGLLHSGTAPGIRDRPSCLSTENWEGFCSTGGSLWTECLGWGMWVSVLQQWIWSLHPDLRSPSGSHSSRGEGVRASSRAHPVLHVQFKGQRNWPPLSFSCGVWQWGGRRPGQASKTSKSLSGSSLGCQVFCGWWHSLFSIAFSLWWLRSDVMFTGSL